MRTIITRTRGNATAVRTWAVSLVLLCCMAPLAPGQGAADSVSVITLRTGMVYTGRVTERSADSLHVLTVDGASVTIPITRIRSEEKRPHYTVQGDSVAVVETATGSTIIGTILRRTPDSLALRTPEGMTMVMPSSAVRSVEMRASSRMRDGGYWYENPNSTRYLIGPSAYSLPAGEGYYLNSELLIQSFAVGLTDNISLSGGFELLSLTVAGEPVFYLAPRVAFPVSPTVGLSAGILYVSSASDSFEGLTVAYGVTTVGNTDNNVSFGVGFGAVDGDWSGSPVLSFSGMLRTGRRFGLVTENWILTGGEVSGIFSYGVRFIGEKLTVDVAFLNNADIMEVFALGVPYVDLMVRF